ncbi:MAG TPA: fumarylacetoacetase [Xanthobacteraceae bacterium]|nr:fumarylacetoacetase [Xanthobacteraceae bacterium]
MRRSWIESANAPGTDFPIQNLPFGIFRRPGAQRASAGIAIGDQIFDLAAASEAGLFSGMAAQAAAATSGGTLNRLMALGNDYAASLRARVSDLLRQGGSEQARVQAMADRLLVPMSASSMQLPAAIGAFTDFFTSVFHAERGGRQRNPDQPLTPNFKYIPIAYNGRASSVLVSGESFRRPNGQYKNASGEIRFGPEPRMDFELEVGAYIARGNALGTTIPLRAARDYIFGYCLVNDWSARSIQAWETVPAGPFQGKSFCTTVSPWVVTGEALVPFHCPAFSRAADDPQPLPYLADPQNEREGGIDLQLEAYILTPRMREQGIAPHRITRSNLTALYWTFGQMITYHASNGTNLVPGDLIASGTVSGASDDSRACLNELSDFGRTDIVLPNGEIRRYLADGDEIILRARAERLGCVGIGFGECRGRVDPACVY